MARIFRQSPRQLIIVLSLFWSIMYFAFPLFSKPSALPGKVITGASRMRDYLFIISGKRVAVVGNQTSIVGNKHLVDTLLSLKVNVAKIFGPEHGFRGNASDGALIGDSIDPVTGIQVISLYGDHRKPSPADLKGIDVILFDIQDVGARFYTYISSLTYIMEACAENKVPLIILDRPNPNGYYIDGPVLDSNFSSFIGMHPVPIVYGMTIGEYALMVNGEHWLKNGVRCELKVISCRNYTHDTRYQLPVKPSPNLPNMYSVYLYPSLCLFEGTVVSVGRGTDHPFEIIGHPDYQTGPYAFTPKSIRGVSEKPIYAGKQCFGLYLSENAMRIRQQGQIDLSWIIEMYKSLNLNDQFFNAYFDKLAGNSELRLQIMQGMDPILIRESWQKDLTKFKKTRNKYLLYPDNQ
jgi:uncharacterized protein YbbC (DUF1343 family)